jgi:hypothetical protein
MDGGETDIGNKPGHCQTKDHEQAGTGEQADEHTFFGLKGVHKGVIERGLAAKYGSGHEWACLIIKFPVFIDDQKNRAWFWDVR